MADRLDPPGEEGEKIFENFERAFCSGCAGCVRECLCGRIFYNPNGGWDWEPGELEELEHNPKATSLDWACETVFVNGREYAMDCECWHDKARQIIGWLTANASHIAEFLSLEKRRKTQEAELAPVVEEIP